MKISGAKDLPTAWLHKLQLASDIGKTSNIHSIEVHLSTMLCSHAFCCLAGKVELKVWLVVMQDASLVL